ncbi:putative bifunctional NMN adenylyltransferase/NUDIX hydrolase protein [Rhizobium phage RHph_I1_18]|nr:putative bifunctional NMN adenylyltransferase/NUDIX hydrolase protein [Rhizobium phage RHph_I1_18]
MISKMKYGVYIGRFQIPTVAHLENIEYALTQVDHLFVVIGTAYGPRDDANPFLGHERREMLQRALSNRGNVKLYQVTFLLVDDYPINEDWADNIKTVIHSQARYDEVYLVGMKKDESSFYLDMFPQWQSIECEKRSYDNGPQVSRLVSSTDLRRAWYEGRLNIFAGFLDPTTLKYVGEYGFDNPDLFNYFKQEHDFYVSHKKQLELIKSVYPYPIQYITADAAVFHNDQLLLIQRGKSPGFNLWALVGGHVESHETVWEGMIRELREESGIDLTRHVIRDVDCFSIDNPRRSRRGRILTHVGVIIISDDEYIVVEAGDDAKNFLWVDEDTLDEMKHQMFEDHYHLAKTAFAKKEGLENG